MSDFILQLIIFISFGVIVYVAQRALPRISDEDRRTEPAKNFLSSVRAHKVDFAIALFLEKNLRRARVGVLRLDNTIVSYLRKIKSHGMGGNGRQKSLFSEETKKESEKNKNFQI